jgi:WhiB family redox-sensing transcriptional regulator
MSASPATGNWEDRALCAEVDPELFFPEGQGNHGFRDAKRVCLACEVRAECLGYALEHPELRGVWGGLSERERGARRQPAAGVSAAPAAARDARPHGTLTAYRRHYRLGEKPCEPCRQANARDLADRKLRRAA